MTLAELLEHTSSDMLADRPAYTSDSAQAPLWSDELIVRYLNRAQQIFARRTYCLIDDSTTAVCEITPVENTYAYALHKSIIMVQRVVFSDSDIPLTYKSRALAYQGSNSGRATQFSTDAAFRKLTLNVAPDATTALLKLNMSVIRLPLVTLSADAPTVIPEIPEEFHMDLPLYAAGMCLLQNDLDENAATRGKEYLGQFEAAIRSARSAVKLTTNANSDFAFGGWGRGTE